MPALAKSVAQTFSHNSLINRAWELSKPSKDEESLSFNF